MRLRSRPAQLGDAISVLTRCSDITKAELQQLGHSPFGALVLAKDYLKTGDAICVHNRQPLFVLGLVPHPMVPRLKLTWFMATQEWFDLGAKGIRLGRRYMRQLADRHPGQIIQSLSLLTDRKTARWFRAHGFDEVDRGGNYVVYEYVEKGDRTAAIR